MPPQLAQLHYFYIRGFDLSLSKGVSEILLSVDLIVYLQIYKKGCLNLFILKESSLPFNWINKPPYQIIKNLKHICMIRQLHIHTWNPSFLRCSRNNPGSILILMCLSTLSHTVSREGCAAFKGVSHFWFRLQIWTWFSHRWPRFSPRFPSRIFIFYISYLLQNIHLHYEDVLVWLV